MHHKKFVDQTFSKAILCILFLIAFNSSILLTANASSTDNHSISNDTLAQTTGLKPNTAEDTTQIRADNNAITDLSDWSFLEDGNFDLSDDWFVYRDQIITPETFSETGCRIKSPHTGKLINLPDRWGPFITTSLETGHGQATYCKEVILPTKEDFLSIQFGTIRSATKIFIASQSTNNSTITNSDGNNKTAVSTPAILVHQAGDPALVHHQSVMNAIDPLVDIPYSAQRLILIVQVSNYIHKQGGMFDSINIGLKNDLEVTKDRKEFLSASLMIIFLMFGGTILMLRLKGQTAFALIALAVAFRVFFVSDYVWNIIPTLPLSRKYDFEYLSVILILASYYNFVLQQLRPAFLKKLDLFIYGLFTFFTLFVIFFAPYLPAGSITLIREPMQALWVLAFFGLAKPIFNAFKKDRQETMKAVFVLFAAVSIISYEVLSMFGIITQSLEWSAVLLFGIMIFYGRTFMLHAWETEQERNKLNIKLQESNIFLQEALEEAKNASRAKSNFLATMSHELRTPLNAIIGFSDVIYHQRLGPDSKEKYIEYARDINASGSHLLSLVNDILDLSKIEANKEKLSISTVDIISLAGSAVNLLSEPMKAKNIRCIIEHSDNPLNIEGDERKLHQILINLLSNATKFNIEDGEIIITLEAKDDLCHITVTDTGIGIPKDQINIALSRFGQIENSSRRQHDGTGIGLPLSKAMIELHGGLLEIESEEGKGTSITVTLPLVQPIQNTNAGASAVITAI